MKDPLLAGARSEHEGRGYVQSDDVVNLGFIQSQESFVRVQVVYDERLPLDNYEGVDITRQTKELSPKSPYDLNVMHITVDGKPIDDLDRSSSDVQRCTDVALDNANIRFQPRQSRVAAAARRRGGSSRCGREPTHQRSCSTGRAFPDVQQLWKFHQAC